jgi:hypothetical protein
MALAGIDALLLFRQFRHSEEQIRRQYLSQNHFLNDLRSDVYVSGTYVRDYLLEPDPERLRPIGISLEDARKHLWRRRSISSAVKLLRQRSSITQLFGQS